MWDSIKKGVQLVFSIYAYLVFFGTGIITLLYYVIISPLPNNTRLKWVYKFNRVWMKTWGYLCGFIFEVNGHDHIDPEETYIFLANHVNILDILTMASHLQHPFMPLAKKEVYKVPILGQLVGLNAIPVDRSSPESRSASFQGMLEKIREKTSILIFAEGTRNRTGKPLKKFYDGGFRLAIASQKPLIPVVLLNTRDLQPVKSVMLKPGRIRLDFLPPIPTIGMKPEDVEKMKTDVWNLIHAHILKEDKKFKNFSPTPAE